MKKLIVANWKMNGTRELFHDYKKSDLNAYVANTDIVVCAPFPFLGGDQNPLGPDKILGAQDCSTHTNGARTGEVSAEMLGLFDVKYCLTGHSERREYLNETNCNVEAKTSKLLSQGIRPIICIGETAQQRRNGDTNSVLSQQLSFLRSLPARASIPIAIAYEPVWAIGSGVLPNLLEIDSTLGFIKSWIRKEARSFAGTRVIYGGSVNSNVALGILSLGHVDGLLIGGASLDAVGFYDIVRAASDTNWALMRD